MTKLFVDNQTLNQLKIDKEMLAAKWQHLSFGWPSFLECIDEGDLFKQMPPFNATEPLYRACLLSLNDNDGPEAATYVYDRLFSEVLALVKNLKVVDRSFLVEAILDKKKQYPHLKASLEVFEERLANNAPFFMHDLILYLAFDRVCTYLAVLFDHQSTNQKYLNGLDTLKQCLIESYEHICLQGRTTLGFYRMAEALFFYEMREENLQKHSEEEWKLLNESFSIIKKEDALSDVFYVDLSVSSQNEVETLQFFTQDTKEMVDKRLAFIVYTLKKIKEQRPNWPFIFNAPHFI